MVRPHDREWRRIRRNLFDGLGELHGADKGVLGPITRALLYVCVFLFALMLFRLYAGVFEEWFY